MDAIIEFLLDLGVVGAVVVSYLVIWVWPNWQTFFSEPASDERRKRLRHDLRRRRKWIRVRTFEDSYRLLLNGLLGYVARYLTHDARGLASSHKADTWPVRLFGLNPFTEGSYLLCLRLALIYPLLGVFVVWLLGGEGALAGMTLLPADQPIGRRVLAVGLLSLSGFLFFKGYRSEGWRSLIYLLSAGVGAFAGVVAVEFIRDRLHSKRQLALYWLGFNVFYGGAVLLVIAWVLPRADNPEPLLALAGLALLLWGLYELLTAWGGTVGHLPLAWVHAIALAVDPSTTAPLP